MASHGGVDSLHLDAVAACLLDCTGRYSVLRLQESTIKGILTAAREAFLAQGMLLELEAAT